jgi:hypothetical protein
MRPRCSLRAYAPLSHFLRWTLDLMIGFIAPYALTLLRTTDNTTLSLFYTLSSSPLHTH